MKKGFTLIELLVVVLIIGVLSAIALPQYSTSVEKARSAEAVTLMSTIRYAAERYRLQMNEFPGGDLDLLDIEVPQYNGHYGSKNYTISASGTEAYVVSATRQNGPAYVLSTAVLPDGTAKRYCAAVAATASASAITAPATAATGDAETVCNAITAGQSLTGNW